MSSIPEYILRKPIEVKIWHDSYREDNDEAHIIDPVEKSTHLDGRIEDVIIPMDLDSFEKLFMPLDRQVLRQQIIEIIARKETSIYMTDVLEDVAKEILALFGLENPGDNKNG